MNSASPNTPLVVATVNGLTDCIKYLLEAGADANIPSNQVVFLFFQFFLLLVGHMK